MFDLDFTGPSWESLKVLSTSRRFTFGNIMPDAASGLDADGSSEPASDSDSACESCSDGALLEPLKKKSTIMWYMFQYTVKLAEASSHSQLHHQS